ncbi:late competence development protein ComFB [Clostridium tepidiprofundi DSM 19306]|uniref:Late competence development protein ComFB n=1 Tax=Clostridium tepidiprofundi DSM 19306 TaxID=1121338 RepID=A0A151B2P9_9CLOT|nr:late competence development ComFB family protein [Clostridium tepidiprofundi]KYH34209.1 late competence development protein ComFB [Clostridium tepidiprofundi DSM 19306]
MYKLRNYSEEAVNYFFDEILDKYSDICKCEKCILDMKAIALNKLGSRYIVTEKGELYSKLNGQLNSQGITDIVKAITEAIEIVSQNPIHDK